MKQRLLSKACAWALCAALGVALAGPAAAEEAGGGRAPAEQTEQAAGPDQAVPGALPAGVTVSAWAAEEVSKARALGLLPETMELGGDYTAPIDRAHFARLAVELVAVCRETEVPLMLAEAQIPLAEPDETGLLRTSEPRFSDTDSAYVELAADLGIVRGSNLGTFGPERSITRAEAAAMLQRTMAALGRVDANVKPKVYSDAYTIPRWAAESVQYISGRTTGDGRAVMGGVWGKFMPQGAYSAEQAIITLLRCYESAAVEDVYADWRSAPGYDTVEIALTFGGDCTFGRGKDFAYHNSFDQMYDQKGAAYFFGNLKDFHNDDLTMVNFEGTLTNSTAARDKQFVFKGRAEYAGILSAGSIDVVTVANNHSMDYGRQGFNDTIRNLSSHVAISGYDRLPVVTVKGVKVGFASNTGWGFDSAQKRFITNSVAALREKGAEIIVFNYHWGIEREYRSNATQRAIAHYCIDSGADLVIGHHPHVVQEVETYRGKQIAYSLGNLSFGGNRNPTDKNCLIFRQNFTVDLDSRAIVSGTYRALPYKISSVDYRNDYRPTPA